MKYPSSLEKHLHSCGITISPEGRRNIRLAKIGNKNPLWKGDKVGYNALHQWGSRNIPKPKFCQQCRIKPPYDLANISQKYKRDFSDWEWLCRSCHMRKDGRLTRLHAKNTGRKRGPNKKRISK